MVRKRKKGGKQFSKNYQPEKRGRKKEPEEMKALKKLTRDSFAEICYRFFFEDANKLRDLEKEGRLLGLEKAVLSVLNRAIVTGDQYKLEFLLQRTLGKVKEEININKFQKAVDGLDRAELFAKAKEAIAHLEKGGSIG